MSWRPFQASMVSVKYRKAQADTTLGGARVRAWLAVLAVVIIAAAAAAAYYSARHGGGGEAAYVGEVRVATLAAGISTLDVIDALDLGQKYGVKVDVVRLGKTPEIAEALARGDVDVAIIPVEYAMLWTMKGTNLTVIAVDMFQNQAILAVDDGIRSPSDLVGKLVGAFVPTSTYNMFKTYMRLAYNITVVEVGSPDEARPDAVNVVNTPPSVMVTSLVKGDVDAIVAFEPIVSAALAKGAHIVEDYISLYRKLGYQEDPVMIVYAARSDWLKEHKDIVEALLKARAEAATLWNANKTLVKSILVRQYKLDNETADILIGRVKICTSTHVTPQLEESIIHVLGVAYDGGFLPQNPRAYLAGFIYRP